MLSAVADRLWVLRARWLSEMRPAPVCKLCRPRWIPWCGLAVGGAVWGLYVATARADVQGGDSGELLAAAYAGGVAHPPGYPLLMLMAHAALHANDPLPALRALLGPRISNLLLPSPGWDASPAYRGALLSAACGGAAAAILFVALALWLLHPPDHAHPCNEGSNQGRTGSRDETSVDGAEAYGPAETGGGRDGSRERDAAACAAFAVALFAGAPRVWHASTHFEVRRSAYPRSRVRRSWTGTYGRRDAVCPISTG
jgi:hypothetical protein